MEPKGIKEDEVLSVDVRAYQVGSGFPEDFSRDSVSGLVKFTSWLSKSVMTISKDGHVDLVVGKGPRILSSTALWKDEIFGRLNRSPLSHRLFQRDIMQVRRVQEKSMRC